MRRCVATLCLAVCVTVLTAVLLAPRPAAAGEAVAAMRPMGSMIDKIVVEKGKRVLTLMSEGRAVKTWPIALGWEPDGHKQYEGDGRTPEGWYVIDYRNDESIYYRSLRISYPNGEDRASAAARGKSPGGDIYIHGQPTTIKSSLRAKTMKDWTAGCIAVSNDAMDELWALIDIGTPIEIFP
ncbi:MAG: L,D-transpeptidase family protein [Caenispirillum bisanense]|nr:L,D-transpeptidase family protein [Caenispirillum bisanense]MCA1973069.1 L,D-transpeptidase family protein [Caenispirillum sp.]